MKLKRKLHLLINETKASKWVIHQIWQSFTSNNHIYVHILEPDVFDCAYEELYVNIDNTFTVEIEIFTGNCDCNVVQRMRVLKVLKNETL